MTMQDDFLQKARDAARASGHIWPDYAACEAALESAWGGSKLAAEGNNLFGTKQHSTPIFQTLNLPTKEFENGQWIVVNAAWVQYPDWATAFKDRMDTLNRLQAKFPDYAAALAAATGEDFVTHVSHTWSTDPQRAAKVLTIHTQHAAVFA